MADFDRPLNARGHAAAPAMGQRLNAGGIAVDILLASTAQRVRETVQHLETNWTHGGHLVWEKQIYLASVPTLLGCLSALDDSWSRAMLIGHNPGLSELLFIWRISPSTCRPQPLLCWKAPPCPGHRL